MPEIVASGTLSGAGTLSGTVFQTLLVGGLLLGSGTLADHLTFYASGTAIGSGTISGTPRLILLASGLPMIGSGTLGDSSPLPLQGQGILAGFLEITRMPEPVCSCECPKVFRWNQWFQIGDLEFRPKNAVGLPFSPVVVVYSLYRILPGGVPIIVGNPNRRPAQQNVGFYYVTGTAGEDGQPGRWFVEWRWQSFWYEEPQTVTEHFHVHAHDPCRDFEFDRRRFDPRFDPHQFDPKRGRGQTQPYAYERDHAHEREHEHGCQRRFGHNECELNEQARRFRGKNWV